MKTFAAALAAASLSAVVLAQAPSPSDALFDKFFAAESPADAQTAALASDAHGASVADRLRLMPIEPPRI